MFALPYKSPYTYANINTQLARNILAVTKQSDIRTQINISVF